MANDRRIYGQDDPIKRSVTATVTVVMKRERMDVIEQLMIRGVSPSKIEKACAERFKMSRGAVAKYIDALRSQWAEEERSSRLTNKTTAQRRLYQHIQKQKILRIGRQLRRSNACCLTFRAQKKPSRYT